MTGRSPALYGQLRQSAVDLGEAGIKDVEPLAQAVPNGSELFTQFGQALIRMPAMPDGLLDLLE